MLAVIHIKGNVCNPLRQRLHVNFVNRMAIYIGRNYGIINSYMYNIITRRLGWPKFKVYYTCKQVD